MEKSSFYKNAASAKKTVVFGAQIALALCLSIPAVIAFAVFMGGGNIKETKDPA